MDHSQVSIFSLLIHLLSLISVMYLEFCLFSFSAVLQTQTNCRSEQSNYQKKNKKTFNSGEKFVNKPNPWKTKSIKKKRKEKNTEEDSFHKIKIFILNLLC